MFKIFPNLLLASLIIMFCGLSGCEKSPKDDQLKETQTMKASKVPQDTPINVITKHHLASLENDEKSYLETNYASSSYDELLKAETKNNHLAFQFLEAIKTKMGDEALEHFQDRFSCQPDMVFISAPPRDEPWWEQIEIEINGNEAYYFDPWVMREMYLIKKDEKWYYDAQKMLPEKYLDHSLLGIQQLITAMEKCKPMIGQPGVTVDDIRREMGKYVDDSETMKTKLENVPEDKMIIRMTTEPIPYKKEIESKEKE